MIILTDTIIPLNQVLSFFLYTLWIGCVVFSFGGVAILFYYRYCILCTNAKFPIKTQMKCLIGALMLSLFFNSTYYYAYYNFDLERLQHLEELIPYFGKADGDLGAVFLMDKVSYNFEQRV